jgi:DNA polymerase-3 subunit epsilon
LHGALLDAELLADVFLAMSRGQNSFEIDLPVEEKPVIEEVVFVDIPIDEVILKMASSDELIEHETLLSGLDKQLKQSCVWRSPPV